MLAGQKLLGHHRGQAPQHVGAAVDDYGLQAAAAGEGREDGHVE